MKMNNLKTFVVPSLLGLALLASCRSNKADEPQAPSVDPVEQIDPIEKSASLVLRIPTGLDTQGTSYELEGQNLWLDKNRNGVQDADEAIAGGGALNLPENAAGESVYLFHGKITSFSVYQPSGDTSDPADEEEEEEEEDAQDAAAEARALTQTGAAAKTATLDASRAEDLLSIEWGVGLPLGAVDLRGAKELRNVELGQNPVATLRLPLESNLRVFKLRGHQLSSLDLSAQTHLQQLLLVRGTLAQITLGKHDELTDLTLSGNALTTLVLPPMKVLKVLKLDRNKLTSLSLADQSYEYLEDCVLSDNALPSVDLHHAIRTKLIDLSRNPLTAVQLPRDLKELRVAGTRLTKLNLNLQGDNTPVFLQKLDASECSELTEVQATQCTKLSEAKFGHCPKLSPASLAAGLAKLEGSGSLSYDQAFSEAQLSSLSARGWTVKP